MVLNAGVAFDQTANGVAGAQCYRQDCTSLAYSTVPLAADVMLDVRNGALVADNYLARIVITGVAAASRGKTVRTLIDTGPSYLEKEDNSNLVVRLSGDASKSTSDAARSSASPPATPFANIETVNVSRSGSRSAIMLIRPMPDSVSRTGSISGSS